MTENGERSVTTGFRDGIYPPKFILSTDGFVRLAYRFLEKGPGDEHEGHQHDIDHGTILIKGAVRIDWKNAEREGSAFFAVTPEEGPLHFMIRADTFHTIVPLEPSMWLCCFLPHEGYDKDLRAFWHETSLGARDVYAEPAV